jgi:hypothetical protein
LGGHREHEELGAGISMPVPMGFVPSKQNEGFLYSGAQAQLHTLLLLCNFALAAEA